MISNIVGDVDPVTDVVVVVIDVLWSVFKPDVRNSQLQLQKRPNLGNLGGGGGAARCPFLACLLLNKIVCMYFNT